MNAALARDWCDILEGMTQDAIGKACMAYLRDEPRRKPAPGAIYALAREFTPRPVVVSKPEPEREKISAERAAEIMAEAGFKPNRFGSDIPG